jgi:hypothetical protein
MVGSSSELDLKEVIRIHQRAVVGIHPIVGPPAEPEERAIVAVLLACSSRALVVVELRIRGVNNLEAGLAHPQADVDVVVGDSEAFIVSAYGTVDARPHHGTRAGDRTDVADNVTPGPPPPVVDVIGPPHDADQDAFVLWTTVSIIEAPPHSTNFGTHCVL